MPPSVHHLEVVRGAIPVLLVFGRAVELLGRRAPKDIRVPDSLDHRVRRGGKTTEKRTELYSAEGKAELSRG